MKMFKKILLRDWEYIVVLLLSFPPFLWLRDGFVLLGHDTGFRIDYLAQLPNLFYSWDPKNNFGVDWSLFKGFLVTQFPETASAALTRSFSIGQVLALVFWFALMGVGMLVLLRNIFPENKYRFFRLFTGIFYMYNFFILNGWGIGERAKFSLWAAMPIALLLLFNVFVKNARVVRNGILFGLLYFFLNGGGVFPLYGGTAIILGIAFIVLSADRIRKSGAVGFWFCLRVLASFTIPFLLINSYYLIADIVLLKSSYTAVLGDHGGINGMIEWERVISKSASFINLIRLQGMPDWYDNPLHPYAKYFLTNPWLIGASFIPFVSALAGFTIFRFRDATQVQRTFLRLLLIILPFALLFSMGTHPPTGILYEFAMKKIPGFVMFRSSFYKFAPAWWFPVIVLSGYFINAWILRFTRNIKGYVFWGFVLILGLLAYHFPYFTTGSFVLNNNFSTRLQIPKYVTDASSAIKQAVSENERILIVPALDLQYINMPVDTYTWGFFSLDILPRNVLGMRSVVANDSTDPIVQHLYDAMYSQDKTKTEKIASLLGIGYILWRGDARLTEKTEKDLPPAAVKQFLDSNADISKVLQNGPWTLYRIISHSAPLLSVPGSIDAYLGAEEAGEYLVGAFGGSNRSFVRADSQNISGVPFEKLYLAADCVMCEPSEYQKLVESLSLPHQRLTPASPLFFLEKAREQQSWKRTAGSPKERIDVDIALAQNYLSYQSQRPDTANLTSYDFYVTDALDRWRSLTGREKNNYAIRLRAYLASQEPFLQGEILQKVQNTSEELARDLWMTDESSYRYFITLDEDGMYEIHISTGGKAVVDGIQYQSGEKVRLTKGLHRIEAAKLAEQDKTLVFLVKQAAPTYGTAEVSFTKVNTTTYNVRISHKDTSPFLLEFREHYDPRWQIRGVDAVQVPVDGFANGWIIQKQGTYDVVIEYAPQKAFNTGVFISIGALLLSGAFILL